MHVCPRNVMYKVHVKWNVSASQSLHESLCHYDAMTLKFIDPSLLMNLWFNERSCRALSLIHKSNWQKYLFNVHFDHSFLNFLHIINFISNSTGKKKLLAKSSFPSNPFKGHKNSFEKTRTKARGSYRKFLWMTRIVGILIPRSETERNWS